MQKKLNWGSSFIPPVFSVVSTFWDSEPKKTYMGEKQSPINCQQTVLQITNKLPSLLT